MKRKLNSFNSLNSEYNLIYGNGENNTIQWGVKSINPYVFYSTFIPGSRPLTRSEAKIKCPNLTYLEEVSHQISDQHHDFKFDPVAQFELRREGFLLSRTGEVVNAFEVGDRHGFLFLMSEYSTEILNRMGVKYVSYENLAKSLESEVLEQRS